MGLIRLHQTISCSVCKAPIKVELLADQGVDIMSSIELRDMRCPAHVSAERRKLLEERPAAERGQPERRGAGGPCGACGRKVRVVVLVPEGTTGTVGSGETRRHLVGQCPPAEPRAA